MYDASINYFLGEIQLSLLEKEIYEKPEFAYCPMCEAVHKNNSNCQRNDLYE